MKVTGKNVLTCVGEVTFNSLYEKNDKGQYTIEIKVPKADAVKLNKELYCDKSGEPNAKLVNFNKASVNSPQPKKLFAPLKMYDAEKKEPIYDEEGERAIDADFVIFRMKSIYPPQFQYKKSLLAENSNPVIGRGSKVQVLCSYFGSDEKTDNAGKQLKYVLLTLKSVRVIELVEYIAEVGLEEDDEYGNAEDVMVDPSKVESKTIDVEIDEDAVPF